MDISIWSQEDWLNDKRMQSRKDKCAGFFVQKVIEEYRYNTPPISSIEIETVNRCNGTCSFCPVSAGNDRREYAKMPSELFYKIIDDFADMSYRGFVSLFSNNEPLLDQRFFEFLKYAKGKLPNARHALFTNGTGLTPERYSLLTASLDYLYLDNYDDDLAIHPHLQRIIDTRADEGNCKVKLMVRPKTQVLNNRGGHAPNKESEEVYTSSCILPFMQMVIRPDGKVSLCCQDAYGDVTLGDLSQQSVQEIWTGDPFVQIRKTMVSGGRSRLKSCRLCDLFGFHNYFPAKWVGSCAKIFTDAVWKAAENGKRICVYAGDNDYERIVSLLRFNGVWDIERIKHDDSNTVDDSAFIILSDYNWDLLEKMDPENNLIGEKYIVFQDSEELQLRALETKPTELDLSNDVRKIISSSLSGKLAVFGAGNNAKTLVDKLGLNVAYFIDNDPEKQGTFYMDRRIVGAADYLEGDTILVSASSDVDIIEQLRVLNIAEEYIVCGKPFL